MVEPYNFEFTNSEELLIYLESNGDYINSPNVPSLVYADEVYMNMDRYLIIDVRDSISFINGHISGAKNVSNKNLFNYIKNINFSIYSKIILVSEAGQSSAYYTSLLRLSGYNNIFSLRFGMAYWNYNFSQIWRDIILNNITPIFSEQNFPKPDFSSLPEVNLEKNNSVEQKLHSRVFELMQEGFSETGFSNEGPSISIDEFSENTDEYFIVCYGLYELYYSKLFGIAHPVGSVNYIPPPIFSELKSIKYLQTLPPDKPIAIYDVNGELSAFTVAYLRILGYDARSVLFGASAMFYSPMTGIFSLSPFLFYTDSVYNYPYDTGN